MKNVLKDVIRHTHDLGEFEAFKLIVTNEGTGTIKASSKDVSVTLEGVIKDNIKDFISTEEEKTLIGFARLNILAGYLKSPIFEDENSYLEVGYMDNGTEIPRELVFKTDQGHRCTYRMMQPEIARKRIKTYSATMPLSDDDFEIIFTPDETFLKEFQSFSSILGKVSNTFSLSVEDHLLYMNLGEDDTAKIPVTETDIETMEAINFWPVKQVLGILKQAPDLSGVTIYVSNENSLIDIKVDTDHVSYSYKLTAS